MPRLQLKQSKIRIRTDSLGSDIVQDDLQFDNPQNNFQKVLNIHPDIPGRQLRNLIQSMSEHCSFEKGLIKKTAGIQVPRYIKSQIKRKQVFQDYEIVKNYAIFAAKKRHFQTRKLIVQSRPHSKNSSVNSQVRKKSTNSMMQNTHKPSKKSNNVKDINQSKRIINEASNIKPTTLHEFVEQKKNKLLMQDNILKADQNNVTNILNDNKKRQKIFEQALFLERLYDIQIEKLKKVGVSENGTQVPEKFRGIQPKHIRISSQTCRNQEQFLRKKYVCKKRKLQFYGHAQKIQQSSLKTKKKQNLGVLSTIMKYNQSKANTEPSQSFIKKSNKNTRQNLADQDMKIQKLFLKYSCSEADNPQQLYKFMGQNQLNLFLQNFNFLQKKNTNPQLKKYLQQKIQESFKQKRSQIKRQNKVKYYLFDFLQILYILASQNSNDKLCCDIYDFLDLYIWPKQDKVIPQSWLKLKKIKKNQRILKFLRIIKFQQKSNQLFKKYISKNILSQFQVPLLNFNDILEMAWQLKLFPLQISKKSLRFIYLYCRSYDNGVCQSDFLDLLIIIGLKFGPEGQNQDKLKWIISQIAI